LTFTADGAAMLVTVSSGELVGSSMEHNSMVVRITPDGKVDPKPFVSGLIRPMGIAVAPTGFGAYGGQVFVTDLGDIQVPVPQTQALKRDGKIYRVTNEGELKLVASGFVNPSGLHFVGNHLWASDINGDFIAGMRELPDGFLVQLDPQ
jgi:glucose/arabinose dehydrogenase